ncbi:hypothetical protein AALA52_07250 [Lactococcus ileimucosae]|uniref:Uncharacterized protein n=1 Tax=Lactococcus ileimucosae TaxID=2941329 RepID=A0ABV4D6L0_9LACT
MIIEQKTRFLFLWISPYTQILKHKKGFGLGKFPTEINITYGIIYPQFVSAILEKGNHRLSVVNPVDFERMFNIKAVKFAQARSVFKSFKNKTFKLGVDKIEIEFSDDVDLESKEYYKTRQITYLASYSENNAQYETSKIEEAMQHLNDEQRLKIIDSKIVISTPIQFKTFVAILHNSILLRILSDEYEIL